MLPKYLSSGCGITVDRRYHNINPIIVISPAGELIGFRTSDKKERGEKNGADINREGVPRR